MHDEMFQKNYYIYIYIFIADAVEFNKNKEELTAMDDELPIIIYIVLMSKFKN
jgi:hypothetical protein